MKRTLILLAGIAAVLASACTKEIVEPKEDSQAQEVNLIQVSLKASLQESKAVLGGEQGLSVLWSDEDKIAVWDGTAIRDFNLIEGEGTKNGVFKGSIAEGTSSITAIYPFEAASISEGALVACLPADQVTTLSGASSLFMKAEDVAVNDGQISDFTFTNAATLFKFTVGAEVDHVVIHSIPDDENGGVCVPVAGASTYASVVLPAHSEATEYFVAVNAGTFPAFRVFFGSDDDHTSWKMLQAKSGRDNLAGTVFGLGNLSASAKAQDVGVITCRADLVGTKAQNYNTLGADHYVLNDFELGANIPNKVKIASHLLDGQGHTISGIQESAPVYACIFQEVKGTSTVKNLCFGTAQNHGSLVQTSSTDKYAVGGVFRWLADSSTLMNITNYVDVSSSADAESGSFIAGVLAQNRSTGDITNCKNYGNISCTASSTTGDVNIGGIVAQVSTGAFTLSKCENHGNISNSAVITTAKKRLMMGGIMGYTETATVIKACVNGSADDAQPVNVSNTASADSAFVGGILGAGYSAAIINVGVTDTGVDNYNYGAISNSAAVKGAYLGGIVGGFSKSKSTKATSEIRHSYNLGSVNDSSEGCVRVLMGGILGGTNPKLTPLIADCANGAEDSEERGRVYTSGNSPATEWVRMAGICGDAQGMGIARAYNYAPIENGKSCKSLYMAGIYGYSASSQHVGQIRENYGSITNTAAIFGSAFIGGVYGQFNMPKNTTGMGKIRNNGAILNTGAIEGNLFMGGLMGIRSSGPDCSMAHSTSNYITCNGSVTNKGTVASASVAYIGGCVGSETQNTAYRGITNRAKVRNEAAMPGELRMGGIIGSATGAAVLSNCTNTAAIENVGVISKNSQNNCLSIGGIIGYFSGSGQILGGVNSGNVRDGSNQSQYVSIGGIAGGCFGAITLTASDSRRCSNTGNVQKDAATGKSVYAGGILGNNATNAMTISGCDNKASVYISQACTNAYFGGIAGLIGKVGTKISDCTCIAANANKTISLTGKDKSIKNACFGGIVGKYFGAVPADENDYAISNCICSMEIKSVGTTSADHGYCFGGIVGRHDDGDKIIDGIIIKDCKFISSVVSDSFTALAKVSVTNTAITNVVDLGGIIGNSNYVGVKIDGCWVDATMTGFVNDSASCKMGILFGRSTNDKSSIYNCKVRGKVGNFTLTAANHRGYLWTSTGASTVPVNENISFWGDEGTSTASYTQTTDNRAW